MKHIGWVIYTKYDNPERWELDDKQIFDTKKQLYDAYENTHYCYECGHSNRFRDDVKKGFVRAVKVYVEEE